MGTVVKAVVDLQFSKLCLLWVFYTRAPMCLKLTFLFQSDLKKSNLDYIL